MTPDKPWMNKWIEIRPLGGGGQGDTLLVRSLSGEMEAVLKTLKPHKSCDAKARGRMALEVTNLKVLRNAGGKVPQVLDGNTEEFEDPRVPLYFVMDYIPGSTLAEIMHLRKGLSLETSIELALDLCSTLRIASKDGIMHRDIKPENLVVKSIEPADIVMVDFGLSFNEDGIQNLTDTEETMDNKFISLPERRGPGENKRDPRSDLTSICAILFYCLTGCVPRNLRDSQGRAPHRWPGYSLLGKAENERQQSALELFFDRGLNYEIDSRFQTIEELIGRLEEILEPKDSMLAEDLETVLAREVAALRRNDRKTQLSEYFQRISELQSAMTIRFSEISTQLSKHRTFYLLENAQGGAFRRMNERTKEGDFLAHKVFAVGSATYNSLHFQIHYSVVSQGPECVIYREIREGQLHMDGKPLDPRVMVLRYSGDSLPNAPIILKDMEAAVGRAITLMSQKIQHGSLETQKTGVV